MLRRSFGLASDCVRHGICKYSVLSKHAARSRDQVRQVDEEEHREARSWLSRFSVKDIPKNICDIHFSRASGPGGQNVNKYVTLIDTEEVD